MGFCLHGVKFTVEVNAFVNSVSINRWVADVFGPFEFYSSAHTLFEEKSIAIGSQKKFHAQNHVF